MATRDFEVKLDDALAQFARDASRSSAIDHAPDTADLISLAKHLQVLAPAPTPIFPPTRFPRILAVRWYLRDA